MLRGALGAGAAAAALYAVGCGSGDDDAGGETPAAGGSPTPAATADASAIRPSLLTREFVANENNRFLVGLLDGQGNLVKDARVHLSFYKIGGDGQTGTLRAQGDADFREVNIEGAHAHDSSAGDAVTDDSVAFYGVTAPFEESGRWGVEVLVTRADAELAKVQVPFDVLDKPMTPANGAMAPKSENDTVATTLSAESLCSRDPQCDLHDKVIADLVGSGRPFVVQFSTPAYCQTRFCGPVLEVLLEQVPAYRDRIDFVHIEVYEDFQAQKYRKAIGEWNLPTEPYTFFVGADGTVRGRLEAIFTGEELVQQLDALLQP